jgi:outer membrane protein OmpA-like peptidoglycan-associated protein
MAKKGKQMSMRKGAVAAIVSLGLVVLLESGCATKKYVKQTVDPVSGRVDELSELSQKNEAAIKDVDGRAQSGIQSAQTKANEVDQKATTANQKAEQATQMAQNSHNQINKVESSLNERIASIDSYKPEQEVSVQFKFDQADLTEESKLKLDELTAQIKDSKNYVLEVRGFTDRTGNEKYNLGLSQRRSDSVIRYLAQHEVPLFRMFILGLGEFGDAQDNKTRESRAANRRVDIVLLRSGSEASTPGATADVAGKPTGPANQPGADQPVATGPGPTKSSPARTERSLEDENTPKPQQ